MPEPHPLAEVATPPPAVLRSPERPWDEADRPDAPVAEPRTYAPHEEAAGRHLVDVHDHLRGELAQVIDLVDQVVRGLLGVGEARSALQEMTLRQNSWTVGAYCASYCRVVATHHTLEDQAMFPHLRRADPALAPVVDRLEQEHHVIHDLLDRVDAALVALVTGGDAGALQAATDLLHDALLSHLSYEERMLVEPLARLGFA